MDGGFEPQVSIDDDHSHQKVNSLTDMDSENFGCVHYRRWCKIRAPCCDGIFDCRHCHNEAKNSLEVDPFDRHDVPRHDVKWIICSLCNTEQDVQQHCVQCGVCMGNYFCSKCKFFDDDVSKKQYHCDGCGICRTGGGENVFHCNKCGCCYSKAMKDSHNCVEKAMHHNCPVCFEFLFDTREDITVLRCGHGIHAQFAQNHSAICPVYGKNLMRRLQGLPCLRSIKIRWFGSSATTVAKHLRLIFTLWHTSASSADPTIRKTREGPASFSSRITAR